MCISSVWVQMCAVRAMRYGDLHNEVLTSSSSLKAIAYILFITKIHSCIKRFRLIFINEIFNENV